MRIFGIKILTDKQIKAILVTTRDSLMSLQKSYKSLGDENAWLIHEIQKFTEMKILLESIETIKHIVMKESRP